MLLLEEYFLGFSIFLNQTEKLKIKLETRKEEENIWNYLGIEKLARDSAEVIVEEPVEKGIPEAVGDGEPGGEEVEEGRGLASGAGGDHFLDRPRCDHDDEAEAHGGHCARSGRRQPALVHHQLQI